MTEIQPSPARRPAARTAASLILMMAFTLILGACQTTSGSTDPKQKSIEDEMLRDACRSYRNQ